MGAPILGAFSIPTPQALTLAQTSSNHLMWLAEKGAISEAPESGGNHRHPMCPPNVPFLLANRGRALPKFWAKLRPSGRRVEMMPIWGSFVAIIIRKKWPLEYGDGAAAISLDFEENHGRPITVWAAPFQALIESKDSPSGHHFHLSSGGH